jgi:C4-dicarboxylate transporter/malic acid transport protein
MPSRMSSDHSDELENGKEKNHSNGKVGFRERISHITWAWFTLTMSTGGIALVLHSTPHQFNGLDVIGRIVYIFDIVLFLGICAGITTRFILHPSALLDSLAHPTESLFFPTFWLSIATIISNMQGYGVPHAGPWLIVALRILFWIYVALTFMVAVGQYHWLFTATRMTYHSMTPSWILPIFPSMLSGTIASVIASDQPPKHALPILVAGLTFQGLGIMVSIFMYANLIGRLMADGLPDSRTRPGMFIAVGPPSFTALAFLGMSKATSSIFPSYTTITSVTNPDIISSVFRIMALATAIFLWSLALWFFAISVISTLQVARDEEMYFHLSWWAMVFPNVGFAIALIDIGEALSSEGILWVGSVMTCLLVAAWLSIMFLHARAVWKRQILWPGRDEDKDEPPEKRD